jgi:hypothetical protein
MTKRETERAARLLAPYVDRTERCGWDGRRSGWLFTAHWSEGGQRLFCTFDEVQGAMEDIKRREREIEEMRAYRASQGHA